MVIRNCCKLFVKTLLQRYCSYSVFIFAYLLYIWLLHITQAIHFIYLCFFYTLVGFSTTIGIINARWRSGWFTKFRRSNYRYGRVIDLRHEFLFSFFFFKSSCYFSHYVIIISFLRNFFYKLKKLVLTDIFIRIFYYSCKCR